MKVLCLLGSPRKSGNTAALAKAFSQEARAQGAEVTTYLLNELEYRGCQACMACKTRLDHCALNDDLTPVLKAVQDCDVLALAAPVYWGDVPSQAKAFIDRVYSFAGPNFESDPTDIRLAPGKKMVFIQAQGATDEAAFADIFHRYAFFFRLGGFDPVEQVRAIGVDKPGEVKNQASAMDQARQAARNLLTQT